MPAERCDVIFFGSQRAVLFFKAGYAIPNHLKVAAVGEKTAALLEELGHKVDFVGEQSGKVKEVGKAFKNWCGERKVLFPISNISKKSISSLFDDDQKYELEVYSTEIVGKEISPCDIYIFTSPSNVQGFFDGNTWLEGDVIAWGESTAEALRTAGVQVNHQLENSSMDALIHHLSQ